MCVYVCGGVIGMMHACLCVRLCVCLCVRVCVFLSVCVFVCEGVASERNPCSAAASDRL